jgi:hypothetical protein
VAVLTRQLEEITGTVAIMIGTEISLCIFCENKRGRTKDRQINIAKPTNPLRALVVIAKIRGIRARILIDSGYLGNFVSPGFVKKAQLHI